MLRIGDLGEKDQRVGLRRAKGGHQVRDSALEQVVAEVHDKRRVAEELLRGESGVRQS